MNDRISAEEARKLFNKPAKKQSKLRNEVTEYGGRTYASKKEAKYAQGLDWKLRQGEIKGWKAQVPYELRIDGILITTYILDFLVEHNDGSREFIDVKGRKAGVQYQLFTLKKHLMKALLSIEVKEV